MITPEMSDAEIMVRLERQPASFSQAAARPPTETQSDVTQTQIGLPAAGVQVAPMVGSALTQSPAAAVPVLRLMQLWRQLLILLERVKLAVILPWNSIQNSWLREMLSDRVRELQMLKILWYLNP